MIRWCSYQYSWSKGTDERSMDTNCRISSMVGELPIDGRRISMWVNTQKLLVQHCYFCSIPLSTNGSISNFTCFLLDPHFCCFKSHFATGNSVVSQVTSFGITPCRGLKQKMSVINGVIIKNIINTMTTKISMYCLVL